MLKYLIQYGKEDNVSFHMPGHKGRRIYQKYGFHDFIENMVDMDITEIKGADNLFYPTGIIKEVEDGYSKLYDSKKTFILINGTTVGIVASILATVPKDKKILVSRGAHKSVHSGILLAGAKPVFITPKVEKTFGIIDDIDLGELEEKISQDEDIKAVILPSPNYYGICSNIEEIAKIVHKYDKILIVDQAHGAHLKLFEKYLKEDNILPKSAESSGADIVINSTHKTLATFTQSAILNIMTDRVSSKRIFDSLKLLQSTSPSYILMSSLAINLQMIEKFGATIFSKWKENLQFFYESLKEIDNITTLFHHSLDISKINLKMKNETIDGHTMEEELIKDKIYPEFFTGDILMGMSGIGNERSDYSRLLKSLNRISQKYQDGNTQEIKENDKINFSLFSDLEFVGYFEEDEEVDLQDSLGEVVAESIIPYPPGIPIICNGEKMTLKVIQAINKMRANNHLLYGISEEGKVRIYKK